jgi:SnoaL-like domain
MSREKAEIVRRWLAAASAGPDEARAAVAEFWDADADYYPVRKFPESKPRHGSDEVARFLTEYLGAFSRYEAAVQNLIAVGDDRVLACTNLRAEGRGSGTRLEGDLYQCYWLRHERFFRVEDHLTLPGALFALGLSGETLEAAGLSE